MLLLLVLWQLCSRRERQAHPASGAHWGGEGSVSARGSEPTRPAGAKPPGGSGCLLVPGLLAVAMAVTMAMAVTVTGRGAAVVWG